MKIIIIVSALILASSALSLLYQPNSNSYQAPINFQPYKVFDSFSSIGATSRQLSFSYDTSYLLLSPGNLKQYNFSNGDGPSDFCIGAQQVRYFNTKLHFARKGTDHPWFNPPQPYVQHGSYIYDDFVDQETCLLESIVFSRTLLDISPDDSRILLHGSTQIDIADTKDFNTPIVSFHTLPSTVNVGKFSPDGKLVFLSHNTLHVSVHNATTMTAVHQLIFESEVVDIQFPPKTNTFLTITKKKVLTVWNLTDYKQVKRIADFDTCGETQYSKDGKYFLYMNTAYMLSIADASTWNVLQTIQGSSCAFRISPDNQYIALSKDQFYQLYKNV